MRKLWWLRLLVAVNVGGIVLVRDKLGTVLAALALAFAVASIERAYWHGLKLMERDRDRWQAKYREEHNSFQRWLRKLGRERHERKS